MDFFKVLSRSRQNNIYSVFNEEYSGKTQTNQSHWKLSHITFIKTLVVSTHEMQQDLHCTYWA